MLVSPKSITIFEGNAEGTVSFVVRATLATDATAVLAEAEYPESGNPTIIPIGSNDFFGSVEHGPAIRPFVREIGPTGDTMGWTEAPGGPFEVIALPDGVDNISVQL